MTWQPIETAPSDGSEFLALFKRQGNVFLLVRFDGVHKQWISKGTPIGGFLANATHWMPLPAPPEPTP